MQSVVYSIRDGGGIGIPYCSFSGIFVQFITMREKQILVWVIGIQKEMAFCSKLKLLLSLKNAWLHPIFFLDAKSTC